MQVGDSWMALCPAHNDGDRSLAVKGGDTGNALIHCHAGCEHSSVREALGLTPADLRGEANVEVATRTRIASVSTASRWGAEAARFRAQLTDEKLNLLATELGVTPLSLRCLGVGWIDGVGWTFPEWGCTEGIEDGDIIGIGVRRLDGSKTCRRDSSRGLIVPGIKDAADLVLVVEGPSDVAACLSMGLTAIGRPSASGGRKHLARALVGAEVIVIGENDGGPGEKGARSVAKHLGLAWDKVVPWTLPPKGFKDVRDWLKDQAIDLADEEARTRAGQTLVEALRAGADLAGAHVGATIAPVLVCLADVEPEAIEWLWPGRIPIGDLTILAGDPGLGKSFVTVDMAARVSTGRTWPDGEVNQVGGVVLLNAEDRLGKTVRPRLEASGADLNQIMAIDKVVNTVTGAEGPFVIETNVSALRTAIKSTPNCRLAVIDPVTAHMGSTKTISDVDVRRALAPLMELANECGVAIVLVMHLNKRNDTSAIHRVSGSMAFTAISRSSWIIYKDTDDPERRVFSPLKLNLGPDPGGLAFRVREGGDDPGGDVDHLGHLGHLEHLPRVVWEPGRVDEVADMAMAGPSSGPSKLDEASELLLDLLPATEQQV
ncbi:MAG: AAA family ATPase, partial [Acidimicrobiia bacterium]|nr:AAA family ATPase [Acidimicrobiia bacterium]